MRHCCIRTFVHCPNNRVAVVTDIQWIRLAVQAFRFLMPGAIRVFALDQAAEARQWILTDQAGGCATD